MKKIFILFLLIGILQAGTYSGGAGTSENPYQISNLNDLSELCQTDADWSSKYFIQTADIDASATLFWDDNDDDSNGDLYDDANDATSTGNNEGFSPLGDGQYNFSSNYNGQGHFISNMTIFRPTSNYIGLFGVVSSFTIENLGFTSANITGSQSVGMIGQTFHNTIRNCYSSGTMVSTDEQCGGLIGYTYGGSLNNCFSTANVSSVIGYAGGLSGKLYLVTVDKCYSSGSVSDNGSDNGGLMGYTLGAPTNSFWDIQTSGHATSAGGTGKTTIEMKTLETFTNTATVGLSSGWDFSGESTNGTEEIWTLSTSVNSGYPYLSNSPPPEIPTPITLTSFTAIQKYGEVELSWQTATEINNANFVIYRNDEAIAWVAGAGTTSEPHNYSYTDKIIVPGITYTYILADVDYANKETKYGSNSVTLTVENDLVETNFVVGDAYPNPFNPRIVFSMQYTIGSNSVVNIYNTRGKLVDQLINGFMEPGNYDLTWDASNMPSGIYIIMASAGDITQTQKIALIK